MSVTMNVGYYLLLVDMFCYVGLTVISFWLTCFVMLVWDLPAFG